MQKVNLIEILNGQPLIGVHFLKKEGFLNDNATNPPSILLISCTFSSFIIDLLALGKSQKLNMMLSQIFENPKSVFVFVTNNQKRLRNNFVKFYP